MNRYLVKIAEMLSPEDKDSLAETGTIMITGGLTGLVGERVISHLNTTHPPVPLASGPKMLRNMPSWARTAGLMGVIGGVGDYLGIKLHKSMQNKDKTKDPT